MTNKEILKGIIEKALYNGWVVNPYRRSEIWSDLNCGALDYRTIIFDLDFNKAFWGSIKVTIDLECSTDLYGGYLGFGGELNDKWANCGGIYWKGEQWKYHLQKISLQAEPLKYYEKFLEGTNG